MKRRNRRGGKYPREVEREGSGLGNRGDETEAITNEAIADSGGAPG